MTRAERNHNPLNIRLTRDKWVGQCSKQTDKDFVQFTSDLFGIRAAFRIIHNGFKRGRNTIRKIVTRWAPPNENDTVRYINYVSNTTSIPPDDILDYDDYEMMCAILRSMAKMESGKYYSLSLVYKAYQLERGLS